MCVLAVIPAPVFLLYRGGPAQQAGKSSKEPEPGCRFAGANFVRQNQAHSSPDLIAVPISSNTLLHKSFTPGILRSTLRKAENLQKSAV